MKNETKDIAVKKISSLPERFGTDINFARFPIFASKAVRGYRTLPAVIDKVGDVRVTRTVSVGTYKDTGQTLDADDEMVFKAIYGRWEKNGCNMSDRTVVSALMNTANRMLLTEANSHRRMGQRDYKKLRRSLDKLARIPIEFDNAYENNIGYTTETILILKKAELFNRKEQWGDHGEKGGKFFEFTKLELNEKICQNIKDGKIKLFYLDQIFSIRGEAARLIYDRLELLGGVVQNPFRRNALEFARECTIDLGPNGTILSTKVIIRKMRRACDELKNKRLTCGIITKCSVELIDDKWFFVSHIKRVHSEKQKKAPARSEVETAAINLNDEGLLAIYNSLRIDQKHDIDKRAAEIHSARYRGMGSTFFAKIDAIKEYVGMANLQEEIDAMTFVPKIKLLEFRERTRPNNESRRDTDEERRETTRRLWLISMAVMVLYGNPYRAALISYTPKTP